MKKCWQFIGKQSEMSKLIFKVVGLNSSYPHMLSCSDILDDATQARAASYLVLMRTVCLNKDRSLVECLSAHCV